MILVGDEGCLLSAPSPSNAAAALASRLSLVTTLAVLRPGGRMEEPWNEGLDISENNLAPQWPEPTCAGWKHGVKQGTGWVSGKENGAGRSPCR